MPIEIIVPRLGWSMEEGAFVAWLKKDGELVKAGEPLFSIEGDKAVQEIESIDSGLLRIAANAPKAGDSIRVGQLLGHLYTANEAPPSATGTTKPVAPPKPSKAKAASPEISPSTTTPAAATSTKAGSRVAISPRALRVAAELGVDWTAVRGTGRTGRIREKDIRATMGNAPVSAASSAPARRSAPSHDTRPKAVFFGEILMRLAAPQHERFVQARSFEVRYTGAEANAAVSLVNFGLEACAVAAVPNHELGQACINYLQQFGVNTDHIARCGSRLGTWYLEVGAPPRPSKVIYDRAGSAFAELKPGQLDWETILAGKQWLHWTGTAPALGPGLPEVVAEGCATAKRLGVKVSCDLNFRSKLWSAETARRVMTPLMQDVDVLIGNEEHIALVLGIDAGAAASSLPLAERCQRVAKALRAQFHFSEVAITMRESNDTESLWQCLLADAQGTFTSRTYPVASVDRIGAGDAFAGALIYSLLTGMHGQQAIEFAAAAGCLKHSIHGDFNLVSRDEVLAVVQGDTGHRVQR